MERYKITILITFILCLIGFDTHAANIFAKSCSVVDVQNAINSARDADTVLVPAGNCTWGTAVSISNKKLRFERRFRNRRDKGHLWRDKPHTDKSGFRG